MNNVFQLMPNLEGQEMMYIQELITNLTETQAQQFAVAYLSRRKDPTNILIFTIIGFLGIAGIQRFILSQVGMGILYLLTCGLCFIGTIVDLINHRKLAFEYNIKEAKEIINLIKQYS